MAEAAIDAMRELGAVIVDPVTFDGSFVDGVRRIADYRFRADWEAYLLTLGPDMPQTVDEFLEIYYTEVAASPLPAEASVLDLLERASATSTDDHLYRDLLENVLPRNTRLKLDLFEAYDLDALIFPYNPSFAPPARDPTFTAADSTYVSARDCAAPSTLAGYSSIGFRASSCRWASGRRGCR